jgi:hypothetical protein
MVKPHRIPAISLMTSLLFVVLNTPSAMVEYHRGLHDSKNYDLSTILRFSF